MATEVYTTQEVKFLDGTELTLKPNSIAAQKKFRKLLTKFQNSKDEEEGMEYLFAAAALSLAKDKPGYWNGSSDANEGLGTYTEEFEEAMDEITMYKVLDICGGTRFSDPNLQAAAAKAAEEALAGKS